jgi:hydroxypyruvate isomerase
MPRFAANLSMLFTEVPMLQRYGRAAAAGFSAVEVQFPYADPAAAIRAELDAHGLQLILLNLPAGDWDAGERGIACLPDRIDEFRECVGKAIAYASALGVKKVNCLAGKVPLGADDRTLRATFVGNLRFAAGELARAGMDLLIEPINTHDIPGFYLNRTAQALSLLDEVDASNAYVQYDAYHMQRMEGELAGTLSRHLARIGHVQIADNPGRNEPGTGEIDHAFLFKHLDRIGYTGWVGAEYKPAGRTEDGLGWMRRLTQ